MRKKVLDQQRPSLPLGAPGDTTYQSIAIASIEHETTANLIGGLVLLSNIIKTLPVGLVGASPPCVEPFCCVWVLTRSLVDRRT
jgi:hypothetical protein